ncbi:hypothetical protein P7D73_20775 [Enterococcus raffinosus]|nr:MULTISPECIES: hypothetical protein [Enterococcus]MDT2482648.1 hypothetical protein [Enterococcus avium]MDT2509344.1 hypothetical protein [Enterococcus avium]MDT2525671.1 hypothetical protein [Enterococcus raffinosus]MDT2536206.1 hypothetical protein [Enterococcus raffinosus]MDT2579989.1 hypothetical protein [Enterococcus raffinosus]
MKQIDKQIAECKSVMDYVSKRVPTILESIENATKEFRKSESEYNKY